MLDILPRRVALYQVYTAPRVVVAGQGWILWLCFCKLGMAHSWIHYCCFNSYTYEWLIVEFIIAVITVILRNGSLLNSLLQCNSFQLRLLPKLLDAAKGLHFCVKLLPNAFKSVHWYLETVFKLWIVKYYISIYYKGHKGVRLS